MCSSKWWPAAAIDLPAFLALETFGINACLKWAFRGNVPQITVTSDSLNSVNSEFAIGAIYDLLEEPNTFSAFLWRALGLFSDIVAVGHSFGNTVNNILAERLCQFLGHFILTKSDFKP